MFSHFILSLIALFVKHINTFESGKLQYGGFNVYIGEILGFSGGSIVVESACNAGDMGLIPGSEKSPRGGNGNLTPVFLPENPMDRGAWRATVHGVTKCWTRLKQLSYAGELSLIRLRVNFIQLIQLISRNFKT